MTYTPFDLTGKVALVTGGNRGIGFGMVQALAQSGADVAIWGTNEERNAQAAAELKDTGVKVFTRKVDVSNEQEVVDGIGETLKDLGRIDSVFANAGVGFGSPSFIDMDTETYRKTLAVNLDGVFWTLRESARHIVERSKKGDAGGSLVGVASLAAIEGAARNQAYAATKGAVISMIKGCAVEYGRYNIRANAILPGWIATDMTAGAQSGSAFAEKVIPRVPIRRWGEPADFGGMAVYLASDASAYTSGTTMIVDGGYSIF
ncbi:MAG: SDR family oxidoreductase [Parvibaculaceae bacterium]|nr:SDR family oxidoreductase [Parvibaculaceae bacterium]